MHVRANPRKKRTAKEEAARQAMVRALGGKYASTLTSSEDFARRKAEEIEIEEHVRTSRER